MPFEEISVILSIIALIISVIFTVITIRLSIVQSSSKHMLKNDFHYDLFSLICVLRNIVTKEAIYNSSGVARSDRDFTAAKGELLHLFNLPTLMFIRNYMDKMKKDSMFSFKYVLLMTNQNVDARLAQQMYESLISLSDMEIETIMNEINDVHKSFHSFASIQKGSLEESSQNQVSKREERQKLLDARKMMYIQERVDDPIVDLFVAIYTNGDVQSILDKHGDSMDLSTTDVQLFEKYSDILKDFDENDTSSVS